MTRDLDSMDKRPARARRGSALAVAAAWAVVVIPAGWGISQTIRTSLRLFVPGETTAAPTTAPAPTLTAPTFVPTTAP